MAFLERMIPHRKVIVIAYVVISVALAGLLLTTIGRDVLPKTNSGQFQVRMRAARRNPR